MIQPTIWGVRYNIKCLFCVDVLNWLNARSEFVGWNVVTSEGLIFGMKCLTFVYTCKYEYMYTIIDFCIKSTHPSTYIHVFTGIHRFLSNTIFQFHRLNVNYRKGRSSTYYFLGKGREINMCRSKVNSLTIRNWCCSLSNSMMRWAADVFLFFRLINWEGP